MRNTDTYSYEGLITTKEPLSTCPPGTPEGRDKIKGMPRINGVPFFPGSGHRGGLRRVAGAIVHKALTARNNGNPAVFTPEDYFYLMVGGIKEGKNLDKENANVTIADYMTLREKNPLNSLFGNGEPFSGGRLQIGNMFPAAPVAPFETHGIRANDFQRDPQRLSCIRRDEVDKLILRIGRDGGNSQIKNELRELRKTLAGLEDEERARVNEKIAQLTNQIEGQVSIQLPNIGHESIPPQTVMTQKIVLHEVTPVEHGLWLDILRSFAGYPYIGANRRANEGEIEAHYRVTLINGASREEVGEVQVGFGLYRQSGAHLDVALQSWTEALESMDGLDFRAPSAVLAKPSKTGEVKKPEEKRA